MTRATAQTTEEINMMPMEVTFKPSGKYWIGSCPSLNVSTQGESFEQAKENLKEALILFFESCLSRGTLEEVLRRAGYSVGQIRTIAEAAQPYIAKLAKQSECRV